MKLEEAKVGMYIARLNTSQALRIERVNQKSITAGWSNIKEAELEDYVIVEKEVVKGRTIEKVLKQEVRSVGDLINRLANLAQAVKSYGEYLSLDVDKVKADIQGLIKEIKGQLKGAYDESIDYRN